MIPRPIDEIEKSDIDSLVAAKTAERRTIEYKEALPSATDEDKREFLYDASSFANAAGGDLIFGVKDQRDSDGKPTGIPESANGLAGGLNISSEIGRLENILQSSIAPRIPGVRFAEVPGFPSGPVLIVRVPKSWAAPHMVTYKGATRFYSRNSTGKYPLDIFEIRSAFALSEALPERMRTFRAGRLAAIVAGETPIPVPAGAWVVLHLVQISALDPASRLDISRVYDALRISLRPMSPGSWDVRFNFDGILSYSPGVGNYVQLFRSGSVEAVEATLLDLKEWRKLSNIRGPDFIPTTEFERLLIEAVRSYSNALKEIGTVPPVSVMVSLLGVRNFRVTTGETYISLSGNAIDRDALILPDVVLEDLGADTGTTLKPIFDAIAQAAGLRGSPNYDVNGRRRTKRPGH